MSTRVRALSALPLVMVFLSACQAAPPAGLSDADKTAIRQGEDLFMTSANGKNFGAAAAAYLDDASVLPPKGPALNGKQEIQKFLSGFPPISDFKLDIVDIDGRGDLAYVRGNYSMTISPPGAAPIHDRGKYVEIWRKQADGSWKIKWDIFNSDVAAPGQ